MRLALGPLLYYWPRADTLALYEAAASWPVDIVYLLDHPDGLTLRTREGAEFLTLNGVQTQSARIMSLAHRLDELDRTGVGVLRLSPQARQMGRVVELFRQLLDGRIIPAETPQALGRLMPGAPCDGYWLGEAGMAYRVAGDR